MYTDVVTVMAMSGHLIVSYTRLRGTRMTAIEQRFENGLDLQ